MSASATAAEAAPKPVTKAPVTKKPAKASASAAKPVIKTGNSIVDTLEEYGFEYTREVIDLAKVNRKQSRLNQARIDAPINEDQVLLYAEGMSHGDIFPPIVVHRVGAEYVVMDGNHRVAGADLAEIGVFDAYVVKSATPAQLTSYVYEANSKHGLPTSMADRLRQAIYLVERGVPRAQAAARLKIPTSKLQSALDVYSAERRFAQLGIRKFDALNQTTKRVLDSIRSDDVLKPAALLVVEAGMGGQELTSFVKRVNEPRTEREALRVVTAEREARLAAIKSTAGGRIPVPLQLQTLARATTTAANLDPDKILQALSEISAEGRSEYARAAGVAGNRLIEMSMLIRRASAE